MLENGKNMEHESDGDTNSNWCTVYSHQRIDKGTVGLGNKSTSGDHPKNNIIKIGQNTKKNPGDLGRFAVIQTPGIYHQLTQMGRTLKLVK